MKTLLTGFHVKKGRPDVTKRAMSDAIHAAFVAPLVWFGKGIAQLAK
jgi:hypothetical protein